MNRIEAWFVEHMTVRRWAFVLVASVIAAFICGMLADSLRKPSVQHVQIDNLPGTQSQDAPSEPPPGWNPKLIAMNAKSSSNLHGLGLACLLYQQDHAQQMPPSLEVLMKEQPSYAYCLKCPIPGVHYVYVSGTSKNPPSNAVIAYEDGPESTVRILAGDGHAAELNRADADAAIKSGFITGMK